MRVRRGGQDARWPRPLSVAEESGNRAEEGLAAQVRRRSAPGRIDEDGPRERFDTELAGKTAVEATIVPDLRPIDALPVEPGSDGPAILPVVSDWLHAGHDVRVQQQHVNEGLTPPRRRTAATLTPSSDVRDARDDRDARAVERREECHPPPGELAVGRTG